MKPSDVFALYQDLQAYIGWSDDDAHRVTAAGQLLRESFAPLVEDFYAEIQRHSAASQVITGGQAQMRRLKLSLHQWLDELFTGPYDELYVERRWRVGLRHVEINLPQVYTSAALSRMRTCMVNALESQWLGSRASLTLTTQSLNKLLDLDLAIISDAYETDHVRRQREAEQRRLDDLIHREKELSAGLLAHAQAAVLVLDSRGRIVRCNPFLEALVPDAGPLNGRDWFELFILPDEQSRLRQALLKPTAGAADTPVTASSTLGNRARPRQLHWSGVPLFDTVGVVFAVLVIGHDITDLHEAQQKAVQSQRLAAIGQVATGLAHESRNALQRIGASAEMLELEVEGNSEALELISRIQQAQSHVHQLLEEVRNYAGPIVLDRSACRITEIWREAWQLVQRPSRHAELRENLLVRDLTLDGDRFRLVQVFRNLLENSLAASSDCIEIVCEATVIGGADGLCIRVRDNGVGLDAEQRRRIFEPFYTTRPTGTGLGTAIAQRLVEAHGGTIAVGEFSGPGTELIITLPRRVKTS